MILCYFLAPNGLMKIRSNGEKCIADYFKNQDDGHIQSEYEACTKACPKFYAGFYILKKEIYHYNLNVGFMEKTIVETYTVDKKIPYLEG